MKYLNLLVSSFFLCFTYHIAKENANNFSSEGSRGDNIISLLGNTSSRSSLITLHLTQNVGIALDPRKVRRFLSESSSGITQSEQAPLFQGMGVHYSYIWVGTPPQRVSVIIDTGSHHTAFPCVGCKCGKHMDPHFDPSKSSTATVRDCNGKKCYFRQAYSEGSSWNAFRVQDKLWIGGQLQQHIPDASKWTVNFDFGCQDSETGLFRTQNIDGIMGMSAAGNTLPFQLMEQHITKTKVFALCFRIGGGVLTLGGMDPTLHKPSEGSIRLQSRKTLESGAGSSSSPAPSVDLGYAKLLKSRGWFTVRLLDVRMRPQQTVGGEGNATSTSIGVATQLLNTGKGAIIDSGTTDTYLPKAIEQKFKALFQSMTGMPYHNNEVMLTPAQFSRLPVIIYRLEAVDDGDGSNSSNNNNSNNNSGTPPYLDVECPPTSYVELIGGGAGSGGGVGVGPNAHKENRKYANRIYLSEAAGTVLGANFMNEFNVIFDPDRLQVGIAKSDCAYDEANNSNSNHSSGKPRFSTAEEAAPPLSGKSTKSSGSGLAVGTASSRLKKVHNKKGAMFLRNALDRPEDETANKEKEWQEGELEGQVEDESIERP